MKFSSTTCCFHAKLHMKCIHYHPYYLHLCCRPFHLYPRPSILHTNACVNCCLTISHIHQYVIFSVCDIMFCGVSGHCITHSNIFKLGGSHLCGTLRIWELGNYKRLESNVILLRYNYKRLFTEKPNNILKHFIIDWKRSLTKMQTFFKSVTIVQTPYHSTNFYTNVPMSPLQNVTLRTMNLQG